MPSLNRNKSFKKSSIYHVYNRGVDRKLIYKSKLDYTKFLEILRDCTVNRVKIITETLKSRQTKQMKQKYISTLNSSRSYYGKIKIFAYCLMPNHFHLLVWQKNQHDMSGFMKSLNSRYVHYFNSRYKRVGNLYQDIYKARLLDSNSDVVNVSRYIHRNPLDITSSITNYPWSSLAAYEKGLKLDWLYTKYLESNFMSSVRYERYKTYTDFVKDQLD